MSELGLECQAKKRLHFRRLEGECPRLAFGTTPSSLRLHRGGRRWRHTECRPFSTPVLCEGEGVGSCLFLSPVSESLCTERKGFSFLQSSAASFLPPSLPGGGAGSPAKLGA